MFWESILIAYEGLRANKMRSLLAMLGIIIGVGAVIAIIAILHRSNCHWCDWRAPGNFSRHRGILRDFECLRMGNDDIRIYRGSSLQRFSLHGPILWYVSCP